MLTKDEILFELMQLDNYISRAIEDLIDSGVIDINKLSEHNIKRLERKRELRQLYNQIEESFNDIY